MESNIFKPAILCADIGYASINHAGEVICGDHVDIIEQQDKNSVILVLADGLGSGVKAGILSTLTSKIISTMASAGLKLDVAVKTIADTLPVCSVRGIAYSTFTIIHLLNCEHAQIAQFDNPEVIMLRNGKNLELPQIVQYIDGKRILWSDVHVQQGDVFIVMSDGVEHAGDRNVYNLNWKREDIINYVETFANIGFSAKTLATLLIDEVNNLYKGEPTDDATVCVINIRERMPVNLLFGPPADRNDSEKMMSLFFAKDGKHIVCGGTTAAIAANYLGKEITGDFHTEDPTIPPTSEIIGVDLVTEGIITMQRVLQYVKDASEENKTFETWSSKQDGASKITRMLLEEATDINFYVGRAVNPAHQKIGLSMDFNIKVRLIEEMAEHLEKLGKRVKKSYF